MGLHSSGIKRDECYAWARIQGGRGEGARTAGQEAEGGQQPQERHLAALVAETAALESSLTDEKGSEQYCACTTAKPAD